MSTCSLALKIFTSFDHKTIKEPSWYTVIRRNIAKQNPSQPVILLNYMPLK